MDRKIEKDSQVPMYEQIAARLKNEILEKKFGSSGNIGTHTQLAEEFGVSLITVRKAVQLLVDEGLLDVVQGKGTFVKNTVLQDDLTRLTGASNIISESHLSAKVDVAAFEIIDTPSSFGPELEEGLGQQCLHPAGRRLPTHILPLLFYPGKGFFVGGGPSAVQQAAAGQQSRTGAHRQTVLRLCSLPGQNIQEVLIFGQGPGTHASGKKQHLSFRFAERHRHHRHSLGAAANSSLNTGTHNLTAGKPAQHFRRAKGIQSFKLRKEQ